MAEISIQNEDFSFYINKMENYKDFLEHHTSNIEKFRKIAHKVLADEDGKYVFDYVTKYGQFDPVSGPKDISDELIAQIEEEFPNCII